MTPEETVRVQLNEYLIQEQREAEECRVRVLELKRRAAQLAKDAAWHDEKAAMYELLLAAISPAESTP